MGTLLIAGFFLFFYFNKPYIEKSQLKPSKLTFNQSNQLPQAKPPEIAQNTPENQTTLQEPAQLDKLNAEEKTQWSVFEKILQTKNDNDPRMDQDLKKLSPAFREALYQKYDLLPLEDHNARGLIVYLVAREISSTEDVQFLKKIFQESPCLSMADCKSADSNPNPHHSSMDQTTLVYQQLSLLFLIDKQLSEKPGLLNDPSSRSGFIQMLAAAEIFPIPSVHEKAQALRTKYGL